MKLKEKLQQLTEDRKAILAVNFYNFETLNGILKAAGRLHEPVILQVSESTLRYLGLNMAVSLARTGLADSGVEGWLHLDHGSSVEIATKCLEAGFDSVMIDASEHQFDENVEITSRVVEIAARYGANVEAELGYVAKLGQSQQEFRFTQPQEASHFVKLTEVDALAVAIGTAHGFYKSEPVLQIELLKKIREATPVALVLHGGSGVPDKSLREAIKAGICKINFATESKNTFMKTLQKELAHTDEIDLRKVFPVAIDAVADLVENKMKSLKSSEF